jgi:hypothetical protein
MIARLCCATVLCLSFAAYAPTAAHAELILTISPGPAANQTTWTFSGSTTTGFANFRTNNPGESEPAGMWGDFPNFTVLDGLPLTKVSGSADFTWTVPVSRTSPTIAAGTYVRPIGSAWVDDGSDNAGASAPPVGGGDRIGVIVPGTPQITARSGDTLSWSGSLVMGGADISAFGAGGFPYSASSTRFYLEPNTVPMTLTIVDTVVPEPSTCMLSLAAMGILALRRSRR